MARVHLFTTSTPHNERRRQSPSPECNIADDAPSPSTENVTIAANATPTWTQEDMGTLDIDAVVASPCTAKLNSALSAPASPPAPHHQQKQEQEQEQEQDLASSTAALTAALLQSAHGNEHVADAVAAALSSKSDSYPGIASSQHHDQHKEQQGALVEARTEDATAAATALQLLGLSHPDATTSSANHTENAQDVGSSNSSNSNAVDANNVMLIANYPGITSNIEDIDLNSDDMIQDYKRGTWTREEDELLLSGIKKFGYGRWKEIATSIPGRKGKQLKQRWDNTLAAKYVDQEWLKNKIRSEDHFQQQQQQNARNPSASVLSLLDNGKPNHGGPSCSSNNPTGPSTDDKALKFLEATDWNDIALKISEKAREGDQHAIEALLSQALLGTVTNHAATSAAASTTATSSPAVGNTDHRNGGSSTPVNNSTVSSPVQQQQQQNFDTFTLQHASNSGTPSASANNSNDDSLDLSSFPRSLDNNPPPLTLADAAALALYANQLSQHSTGGANPYFMPFGNPPNTTNDSSVAAAAAQHQHPDTRQPQAYASSPSIKSSTPCNNTALSPSSSSSAIGTSVLGANKNIVGGKRRRSDPALADTQSAAMTIYASATPITTTINNQTQTVFPCLFPNCGKTFARLYNLKSHSRTHTDDRPFVCHACTAAFSRNHDLKRHSKIHGGDKPYKCEGCQKSFSRLDALKRHKSNQRNKQGCTEN